MLPLDKPNYNSDEEPKHNIFSMKNFGKKAKPQYQNSVSDEDIGEYKEQETSMFPKPKGKCTIF